MGKERKNEIEDKAADKKILEALGRMGRELTKSPHPSIYSEVISIITVLQKKLI